VTLLKAQKYFSAPISSKLLQTTLGCVLIPKDIVLNVRGISRRRIDRTPLPKSRSNKVQKQEEQHGRCIINSLDHRLVTRIRDHAAGSSIILCSDAMTFRSMTPKAFSVRPDCARQQILAARLRRAEIMGWKWRITPEPVIGPRIALTRWTPIRLAGLRQRAGRSNDSEAETMKSSRTAAFSRGALTRHEYRRNHIAGLNG
jgi:hypothetical protein